MFIPLVDSLRCPRAHEDTWLVASIDLAEERHIREGILGCPKCLAEYPIREGIVYFAEPALDDDNTTQPNEEDAVRVAAALDLTDARMTAVLHGSWGVHAPIMRGFSPAQLILLNPPRTVASGDGISIVYADTAPIARAIANGVAFGANASAAMRDSLVATLKAGGRLLGPTSHPVPPEVRELARDADVWVARLESSAMVSAPILPTRRPKTTEGQ
jgi:uncharacterized protein YbaR (Trm112 family)